MLYLGRTLKVCFVEAVLRDERDAVIGDLVMEEVELTRRHYAEIEITRPLTVLDLRDDARLRQGVPSDIVGGKAAVGLCAVVGLRARPLPSPILW